jgi:hypothetical protein
MTPIESWVDKIVLINLKRRTDRLAETFAMLESIGIERDGVTVFEAHEKPLSDGRPSGNAGCVASHRGVYELIAHHKWNRTLVLEDDADIAFTNPSCRQRVDPQALFASYIPELPSRFCMIYLGRHFAEMPLSRKSPHVVKIGRMLTTSSYIIEGAFAREIAPYISGNGPIDNLLWQWHRDRDCYCVDPTLFIQRKSFSDLRDQVEDYVSPMQDMNHLRALDLGRIYPPPPRQ